MAQEERKSPLLSPTSNALAIPYKSIREQRRKSQPNLKILIPPDIKKARKDSANLEKKRRNSDGNIKIEAQDSKEQHSNNVSGKKKPRPRPDGVSSKKHSNGHAPGHEKKYPRKPKLIPKPQTFHFQPSAGILTKSPVPPIRARGGRQRFTGAGTPVVKDITGKRSGFLVDLPEEPKKRKFISPDEKMRMMKKKPKKVTLYVLGDQRAGKMSLIRSFLHEEYVKLSGENEEHDIPEELFVTYRGRHYVIKLSVPFEPESDEERMSDEVVRIRKESYDGTECFILCYSVYDALAFKNIERIYLPEIRSICGDHVPFIVVGTKSDLRPDHPSHDPSWSPSMANWNDSCKLVDRKYAETSALSWGAKQYLECAALGGDAGANGVNAVFQEATIIAKEWQSSNAWCLRSCVIF